MLEQVHLVPNLQETINANPKLVVPLLPWEEKVKTHWDNKLAHKSHGATFQAEERSQEDASHHHRHSHDESLLQKAVDAVKHLKGGDHSGGHGDVHSQHVQSWIGKVAVESSVGNMVKEFLK